MFVYLLPVHLSLLIFGLVISENTTNVTVQVSANGSDTPSCIQNNTSCKTMMYVLDRISNMSKNFHQNTSITVKIACSQIIESHDPYKFASSFPLSVRLIGHNNISIVFKEIVHLTIVQESESEFKWAWIGFTIFAYDVPFEITSVLRYENMNYLAVHNCKIVNTTLTIINTRSIVIDSTEFGTNFGGNSLCPSIDVTTVTHSTSFTFSNNNFSTCECPTYMALVTFYITEDDSNLTIINCTCIYGGDRLSLCLLHTQRSRCHNHFSQHAKRYNFCVNNK